MSVTREPLSTTRAAQIFKLLGDPTRLTIIGILEESDCCVGELVEMIQTSQPSISQHLRKLRDVGIVTERRQERWVFYCLDRSSDLYPLLQDMFTHLPAQRSKLEELEKMGLRICCD